MILQGLELQKGQTVYALLAGKWKACEVSDLSEPMKAAKVTYVKSISSKGGVFKSEWFSVRDLARTI